MFRSNEILDLQNRDSLTRKTFDRKIHLSEYGLEGTSIPKGFKGMSFTPKGGLNLPELMKSIEKDLSRLDADSKAKGQISNGLCEAIKNAYEHGNGEDNSLKIDLFRKYSGKRGAEFLVGDRGSMPLDGNFIPYAMVLRNNEKEQDDPENFTILRGRTTPPKDIAE